MTLKLINHIKEQVDDVYWHLSWPVKIISLPLFSNTWCLIAIADGTSRIVINTMAMASNLLSNDKELESRSEPIVDLKSERTLNPISALPQEIQNHIFGFLTWRDKDSLQKCSKLLHASIKIEKLSFDPKQNALSYFTDSLYFSEQVNKRIAFKKNTLFLSYIFEQIVIHATLTLLGFGSRALRKQLSPITQLDVDWWNRSIRPVICELEDYCPGPTTIADWEIWRSYISFLPTILQVVVVIYEIGECYFTYVREDVKKKRDKQAIEETLRLPTSFI